ncbi:MAG: hypothetical protein PLY_5080 [Periwinkle leaf yellowing phytoplasma]|nr:MAG: hypothetical protein PLY_5080 [Periwinkle leaf yellowing phytoplasma]
MAKKIIFTKKTQPKPPTKPNVKKSQNKIPY